MVKNESKSVCEWFFAKILTMMFFLYKTNYNKINKCINNYFIFSTGYSSNQFNETPQILNDIILHIIELFLFNKKMNHQIHKPE